MHRVQIYLVVLACVVLPVRTQAQVQLLADREGPLSIMTPAKPEDK